MFYFNPRPREEGDAELNRKRGKKKYFNPRPREEGDLISDALSGQPLISIHALVKRATKQIVITVSVCSISIHALVKRATYQG